MRTFHSFDPKWQALYVMPLVSDQSRLLIFILNVLTLRQKCDVKYLERAEINNAVLKPFLGIAKLKRNSREKDNLFLGNFYFT